MFALIGALFNAVFNSLTKYYSKSIHYMVSTMYKQFSFCLFAPLLAIIDFEVRKYPTIYSSKEVVAFAVIGALSFFYYYFMHKALDEYNSIHTTLSMRHPFVALWIILDIILLGGSNSSLVWFAVLLLQGSSLAVFVMRIIK